MSKKLSEFRYKVPEIVGFEGATWDRVPERDRVERWVGNGILDKRYPITIYGSVGCGKTYLAYLLRYCCHYPVWFNADEFLTNAVCRRSDPEMKYDVHRALNCSCLILDDFGSRPPSPVVKSFVRHLFDQRVGRGMILTSNLTPEHLGEIYDDRVYDRITAGTVVHLDGPSQREGKGRRHSVNYRPVKPEGTI